MSELQIQHAFSMCNAASHQHHASFLVSKNQIVATLLRNVKEACAAKLANRTVLQTCKGLAEASEVEESSLGHGDQLTQEHQEGDGGEDHGEDHEGLDRLQPVLGR